MDVCQDDRAEDTTILLDRGALKDAPANWPGRTALQIAADMGKTDALTVLLNGGADKKILDKNGWTALMLAANMGHRDVITALLDHKALTDTQNSHGNTALHLAAEKGDREIVTILLDRNAPTDTQNTGGCSGVRETALDVANRYSLKEVAVILRAAGALPSSLLVEGTTPLHKAAYFGATEEALKLWHIVYPGHVSGPGRRAISAKFLKKWTLLKMMQSPGISTVTRF